MGTPQCRISPNSLGGRTTGLGVGVARAPSGGLCVALCRRSAVLSRSTFFVWNFVFCLLVSGVTASSVWVIQSAAAATATEISDANNMPKPKSAVTADVGAGVGTALLLTWAYLGERRAASGVGLGDGRADGRALVVAERHQRALGPVREEQLDRPPTTTEHPPTIERSRPPPASTITTPSTTIDHHSAPKRQRRSVRRAAGGRSGRSFSHASFFFMTRARWSRQATPWRLGMPSIRR